MALLDPQTRSALLPVVVLALWTFVMWFWMYGTRLPAMRKMRMKPDPDARRGEQMAQLPASTRWKADNYTHLMEQPTVFYPVAIVLALAAPTAAHSALGWAYVAIRIVHSLCQALVNKIEVRFVLFALSSMVLLAMSVAAAMALVA
jgi:hypothetical protein